MVLKFLVNTASKFNKGIKKRYKFLKGEPDSLLLIVTYFIIMSRRRGGSYFNL